MKNYLFRVEKANIYRVNPVQLEPQTLQDGEILLKIDKYALTTNNITYAVSGEKLGYWNFYPTDDPYGVIPVWGYAEVVDSKHSEIEKGQRYYGYFPMAAHCILLPQKVNNFGFSDGMAHRLELPSIYNYYTNVSPDPSHSAALENYQPIIKPLFATSYLLYQFFKSEAFLGADQVILTSASSKTALALAFMLKQNQENDQKEIIALTSGRNVAFVQETGFYNTVLAYENYQEIPNQKGVVVDMSGNFSLLQNLSSFLNDRLQHIALVGLTDWKAAGRFSNIPKAKFFFAPTYMKAFYKTHGPMKANQLLNEELVRFIDRTKDFMQLEMINNIERLSQLYLEMVDGKVDPRKGYIVQIGN